jgi:AcrR family transcriptional regulator
MRTKTPLQADKILRAAGHLFGTQRFHEVRMDDIAAQAEVSKGTLYRYFNDKEELYLALVARSSEEILIRVKEAMAPARSPRDKLESVVTATIAFFDEQPHLFDLVQRAEVMTGPGFPWKKTREELLVVVSDLLRRGMAQGEFTVRDVDLTTQVLLGGLRSVIRFGKQPRPRDLARRMLDVFLHEPGSSVAARTVASKEPSALAEPSRV